ncbi:MAG: L,D-transpeptidase family protein [Acidobacteria bacterium]|nr:L,D-transpeptidase family protein [Acidobacteriota bacterium]
MKNCLRARGRAGLSLALALTLTACQNAPVSNVNTNAPASNANAASPAPAASAASAGANEQPVTLAVLDALFAEDSFAQELKSKAGLTDEQLAGLRKAAGEERGSLRESDADDHGGTTSAASERATQKITAVLGAEKARQVLSLARERWAGEGGATATAERPNALPTDTRIVVNAPAYRMDVFENGRLVKTYKVGIGYPEFPLPAGMRKADTIIYNPTPRHVRLARLRRADEPAGAGVRARAGAALRHRVEGRGRGRLCEEQEGDEERQALAPRPHRAALRDHRRDQ